MRFTVKERAEASVKAHPRTWTAREMAQEKRCSYSTARTALKQLCDEGVIKRVLVSRRTGNGWRYEWAYYRWSKTMLGEHHPRGGEVEPRDDAPDGLPVP